MNKFRINDDGWNKGFQIDFENGVTVSIQFGEFAKADKGAFSAEVAVFRDDEWFVIDTNVQELVKAESGIMPYCSPEAVAWIIDKAKNIK